MPKRKATGGDVDAADFEPGYPPRPDEDAVRPAPDEDAPIAGSTTSQPDVGGVFVTDTGEPVGDADPDADTGDAPDA